MLLVVSSYKTNGEAIKLIKVENNDYKVLDSSDILSPSFVINDDNYVFTYEKGDNVTLYSYLVHNNKLLFKDKLIIPGQSITHLTYSKKNNLLIGCSYNDGTFFSVSVDEGKFISLVSYQKQIEDDRLSRCHAVILNKEETKVYIINIALDKVFVYDINEGKLNYSDEINLPNGSGPRHAVFNNSNYYLYIMTEYSNEVIVVDVDSKEVKQIVSTIPNYSGITFGATLLFSNDNKYLYASNRGEDTIAKFKVLNNGKLDYLNSFSCGGNHPRHMILSNDGEYLISCNKNSNNVNIIDLDSEKVVLDIPFENTSGVTEIL